MARYTLTNSRNAFRLTFLQGDHSLLIVFEGSASNPRIEVTKTRNFTMMLAPNVREDDIPGTMKAYTVTEARRSTSIPIPMNCSYAPISIVRRDGLPAIEVAFYERPTRRETRTETRTETRRERSRSRERSPIRRAYSPTSPEVTPPTQVEERFLPVTEMQAMLTPENEEIKTLRRLLTLRGVILPKVPTSTVSWYIKESDIPTLREEMKAQIDLLMKALIPPPSPVGPPEVSSSSE